MDYAARGAIWTMSSRNMQAGQCGSGPLSGVISTMPLSDKV